MAKKKNPADATIRNVRAGKKRDAALAKRVKFLEHHIEAMDRDIDTIYERHAALKATVAKLRGVK